MSKDGWRCTRLKRRKITLNWGKILDLQKRQENCIVYRCTRLKTKQKNRNKNKKKTGFGKGALDYQTELTKDE